MSPEDINPKLALEAFDVNFQQRISAFVANEDVVAFKSISCYRIGLDLLPSVPLAKVLEVELDRIFSYWQTHRQLRLENKDFNNYVVHTVLRLAPLKDKPGKGPSFSCVG